VRPIAWTVSADSRWIDRADHARYLLGRLGGPVDQLAHLIGEHGKAFAVLAGPGGFNGGIVIGDQNCGGRQGGRKHRHSFHASRARSMAV
jgi:hypothetical protein